MLSIERRLSTSQIIVLEFVVVILLGSLLLSLPIATKSGTSVPYLSALFTATSASCVTGLVVVDTATTWSAFGQGVILLLIQIGGLGVIMMAVTIFTFSGHRISLKERDTIKEAIAAPTDAGIVRMAWRIFGVTLLFELVGAACMAPFFCDAYGLGQGIWMAVFHGVSAFCNAGFDILGTTEAPFASLTAMVDQPVINIVIMLLIIIGGIGFMTWEDVRRHGVKLRRYRMQSKVILVTTAILIVLPALYYFFFEFNGLDGGERVLVSLFTAVTPRTAGFNTVNFSALSETGLGMMIILMLVGGSPGSTAGGMKTTTLAVIVMVMIGIFRRRRELCFFRRRVKNDVIRTALALLVMYLVLFLAVGMVISSVEELPLLTCLFESASALGTVGLTLGITPGLSTASQLLLILLMIIGRIGGLTLIFSALPEAGRDVAVFPEEKLMVG